MNGKRKVWIAKGAHILFLAGGAHEPPHIGRGRSCFGIRVEADPGKPGYATSWCINEIMLGDHPEALHGIDQAEWDKARTDVAAMRGEYDAAHPEELTSERE